MSFTWDLDINGLNGDPFFIHMNRESVRNYWEYRWNIYVSMNDQIMEILDEEF